MTPQVEKEIHEIKMQLDALMKFVSSHDRVTNVAFCNEQNMETRTLRYWFEKGCPREDNRHVSRSRVLAWARENATHATSKLKRA